MVDTSHKPLVLFNFPENVNLQDWYILDDVVMGGRSQGTFGLNEEGHGVFAGEVSLENYGGFSSVRFITGAKEIDRFEQVVFRIRGDKKRYQLRLKTNREDAHSFIQNFETNGEWQTVSLDLASFYPTYRGRTLDMPNYPGVLLSELSFLISNKRAESFQLELEWMELR